MDILNRTYKTLYNNVRIPTMFMGTFQVLDLAKTVDTALQCGLRGFDTAPSYKNEEILGNVLYKKCSDHGIKRSDIFISDKIDIWQMQKSNGKVHTYVMDTIKRMQIQYIDLLLIHWPLEEYLLETWKSFEDLYVNGVVKSIGICNSNKHYLERILDICSIKPMVVQVERHPLNSLHGLIDFHQKHEIITQAYSPLCRMNVRIKDSVLLRELTLKYKKNIGQIVLRWHIQTGSIPIFMSNNLERLKSNYDIFDFEMDELDEISITKMNEDYRFFIESWSCPGY